MDDPQRHVKLLDYIRGFAILAVLCYHTLGESYGFDRFPWSGWHRAIISKSFLLIAPFTFGWVGVPVFFVVSGFCIHLSFSRKPNWRNFFVRRFFRIYPPYLMALLFFVFVFPFTKLGFLEPRDYIQFVSHLLLAHNFSAETFFGINGPFWSIAVEAQLYLVYPLIYILAGRIGWRSTLVVTAGIEITMRFISYLSLDNYASGTLYDQPKLFVGCYWFSWTLGAYLAEVYLQRSKLPFAKVSTVFVAAAAIASELIRPLSAFSFTLFALLTATVIAKQLARETPVIRLPKLVLDKLAWIGLCSYSIYLLHGPILHVAATGLRSYFPGVMIHAPVLFCALTVAWLFIFWISILWYHAFELTGIAIGKRVLSRVVSAA